MKKKGKMIEILSGEFPMKKTLKIEESFWECITRGQKVFEVRHAKNIPLLEWVEITDISGEKTLGKIMFDSCFNVDKDWTKILRNQSWWNYWCDDYCREEVTYVYSIKFVTTFEKLHDDIENPYPNRGRVMIKNIRI
jgi:hypothetical protein